MMWTASSLLLTCVLLCEGGHSKAPVSLLHELVIGQVVTCCGPRYEALRTVNNKACVSRVSHTLHSGKLMGVTWSY